MNDEEFVQDAVATLEALRDVELFALASGAIVPAQPRDLQLQALDLQIENPWSSCRRVWFVIQHVREKVSCRCCEAISEAPAPLHPIIARGRAGPNLLAEVVFGKYGLHLPLNRQSADFGREGIDLDVSTLADWVGAVAASLQPLTEAIEAHVCAAARIHADETPVPVLAKGKTREGRLWTIVRDDRPFGGRDPPAAVFFYSPDRSGVHAERFLAGYTGIMQADVFSGFGCTRPIAGRAPHRRGGLLSTCPPRLLRAGRAAKGADRDRGGEAH